jgi:hypothetical protein
MAITGRFLDGDCHHRQLAIEKPKKTKEGLASAVR